MVRIMLREELDNRVTCVRTEMNHSINVTFSGYVAKTAFKYLQYEFARLKALLLATNPDSIPPNLHRYPDPQLNYNIAAPDDHYSDCLNSAVDR